MALDDEERYKTEMKHLQTPGFFLHLFRPEMMEQNPVSFRDADRRMLKLYKTLTAEEKHKYKCIARDEEVRYNAYMQACTNRIEKSSRKRAKICF